MVIPCSAHKSPTF